MTCMFLAPIRKIFNHDFGSNNFVNPKYVGFTNILDKLRESFLSLINNVFVCQKFKTIKIFSNLYIKISCRHSHWWNFLWKLTGIQKIWRMQVTIFGHSWPIRCLWWMSISRKSFKNCYFLWKKMCMCLSCGAQHLLLIIMGPKSCWIFFF